MASSSSLSRRKRGQSLLFSSTASASDSGELTETTSRFAAKREGNKFHRSSSTPLISLENQSVRTRDAGRHSCSYSQLARKRSSSSQQLGMASGSQTLTPPQPQLVLRQPVFSTSSLRSNGSDADEDEVEVEYEPEAPLLLRRSTQQLRGMSHRKGLDLHDNGRTVSPSPRTRAPQNGHTTHSKSNGRHEIHEGRPITIGISSDAIHWTVNLAQITPLLFQWLRILAAIPASVETVKLLLRVPYVQPPNSSLDYIASATWSILTAYQALCFTTGLLNRWRHYYPLPATLIRLVALQAICWPATFYTLRFLQYDGVERPLVCWAVIGTTTCITRSIQMWVTSNIDDWHRDQDSTYTAHTVASIALGFGEKKVVGGNETEQEDYVSSLRHKPKTNGKVRKWDWNEVVWKWSSILAEFLDTVGYEEFDE